MNKQFYTLMLRGALCVAALAPIGLLQAQDTTAVVAVDKVATSKSTILIGTQIPLQFTAGYEYRFSNKVSVRAQAGFITKPYSGFIVDAMEAFGMDEYLSRVIRKSFHNGTVLGVGPIVHWGKNYVGAYAQYMHLKAGGITPGDALSVYFKKDFTQFDVTGLPAFQFNIQSNIINAGILAGRSFALRNPHFSINAEVGITKIVGSKNSFSSNRSVVDQTTVARTLFKEIDASMREAYIDYGYIPTVNVYLVYRLR